MSEYLDKAKELRANVSPHYNCAQAVVIPFAEKAGITSQLAWKMAYTYIYLCAGRLLVAPLPVA